MNKERIFSGILLFILIISITSSSVTAVGEGAGILPGTITIHNALKGNQTYTRDIRLTNSVNDTKVFKLGASGDIAYWVTFYYIEDENLTTPINNITVPAFTKEHVNAVFQIPTYVANGFYEGNIFAEIAGQNETGVGIILKLPISVLIEVTGEQILAGNVTSISTSSVEVGLPLKITVDFTNLGNVIATPTIQVDITRPGYNESFSYSDTDVNVESGTNIKVEWDTSNREPGDYNARIRVILGDNILADQNESFELLPRGTFTRKGDIVSLNYTGDLAEGSFIFINAQFRNSGEIETTAKFEAEVYLNGELIDIIESDQEPTVPKRETYVFSEHYKIEQSGSYTITGYVLYENNQTTPLSISFNVGLVLEDIIPIVIGIIGVVCTIIFIFLIIVVFESKKAKKKLKNEDMKLKSLRKRKEKNRLEKKSKVKNKPRFASIFKSDKKKKEKLKKEDKSYEEIIKKVDVIDKKSNNNRRKKSTKKIAFTLNPKRKK